MRRIYRHAENTFEKLTSFITVILGNSITFILALITVIYWLSNKHFLAHDTQTQIGEVILGITFLSLFIIQKSFNKFSGSLHLKINELVIANKSANNSVVNAETKTELEITELTKEYAELAEEIKEVEKEITKK
jgi:low affinity Fe/Cu permease